MKTVPLSALLLGVVSTLAFAADKAPASSAPSLPKDSKVKVMPGTTPLPGKDTPAVNNSVPQLNPAIRHAPEDMMKAPGRAPSAIAPATQPGMAPGKRPSSPSSPGAGPAQRPANAGVQILVPGTASSGKDGMAHDSAKGVDKPTPAPTAPVFGGPGTQSSSSPATRGPKYDSGKDVFRHADGSVTRGSDPRGNTGKVSDKGDIVYSDGTSVSQDPATGNRFVNNAGGRRAPGAPDYDAVNDEFVYDDGSRVRGSDPMGNVGKVNEKGDIVYNDGTMVVRDPASGRTTVIRPGAPGSQSGQQGGPVSWGKGTQGGSASGTGYGGGHGSQGGDKGKDNSGKDSSQQHGSNSAGKDKGKDNSGSDDKGGKDDKGSNDKSDKDSGSKDSGSDSGSKDTGGKDSGKDDSKDAGADKRVAAGQGGASGGPSSMVQDIVDRRTGKKRDPESVGPGEGDAGCTNDGQPGGVDPAQGGCNGAGSLPTISTEGQGSSNIGFVPPGATRSVRGGADPDCFNPEGCGGLVPGRTLDPFDRSAITNPGEPR